MKVAQHNKIGKDLLKMLLVEKMQSISFRKIITFAGEDASSSFSGDEYLYSKLKDYFKIEIIVMDIIPQLREFLINTKKGKIDSKLCVF